jgi:hypothetical protein
MKAVHARQYQHADERGSGRGAVFRRSMAQSPTRSPASLILSVVTSRFAAVFERNSDDRQIRQVNNTVTVQISTWSRMDGEVSWSGLHPFSDRQSHASGDAYHPECRALRPVALRLAGFSREDVGALRDLLDPVQQLVALSGDKDSGLHKDGLPERLARDLHHPIADRGELAPSAAERLSATRLPRPALIAAGKGDGPLVRVRLRCRVCGGLGESSIA